MPVLAAYIQGVTYLDRMKEDPTNDFVFFNCLMPYYQCGQSARVLTFKVNPMSKSKDKRVAVQRADDAPAPVIASPVIAVIKSDAKLRGAREAWYVLLKQHDGKPVSEFYAAAKATPPALTKAGTAEDPRGWMRWFLREKVAELRS